MDNPGVYVLATLALATALLLSPDTAAMAQQGAPQAVPVYSVSLGMRLSLTGKQVEDLVNALATSEIPASIAVPMISGISSQIQAQNQAREAAARKAVDDIAKAAKAENDAAKAKAAEDAAKPRQQEAPAAPPDYPADDE